MITGPGTKVTLPVSTDKNALKNPVLEPNLLKEKNTVWVLPPLCPDTSFQQHT